MFLNTFHLSNIYKYVMWNPRATSQTKTQRSSTCLPRVSSHFRTVVSLPHHAERIWPFGCPVHRRGRKRLRSLSICGPLPYRLRVKPTGYRAAASASPDRFSAVHSAEQWVYCAPRGLEEWRHCLRLRGFLPWQDNVSVHYSWHRRSPGIQGGEINGWSLAQRWRALPRYWAGEAPAASVSQF